MKRILQDHHRIDSCGHIGPALRLPTSLPSKCSHCQSGDLAVRVRDSKNEAVRRAGFPHCLLANVLAKPNVRRASTCSWLSKHLVHLTLRGSGQELGDFT